MPLYEYQCAGCGHRFERLQRVGSGPEGLSCPRCGGGDLQKQFSTFSGASSAREGGNVPATSGGCGPGSGFT